MFLDVTLCFNFAAPEIVRPTKIYPSRHLAHCYWQSHTYGITLFEPFPCHLLFFCSSQDVFADLSATKVLGAHELYGAPVLILANKQVGACVVGVSIHPVEKSNNNDDMRLRAWVTSRVDSVLHLQTF